MARRRSAGGNRLTTGSRSSAVPDLRRSSIGRQLTAPERAVLVGVDFGGRQSANRAALVEARKAASRFDADRTPSASQPALPAPAGVAALARASISPGLDARQSLAEFRELVSSAGAEVVAEVLQRRPAPEPATLIGSGKVEEIAALAGANNTDLILFDHDLSPTQLRNLEAALPCRVLDRTQLILDIFARHARTREGQLQVELAQLEYLLPRLAGRGKSMSQLGGGIGTRGPGETQLETDRRRIQRRIDRLKSDLESVRRVRRQQRSRREAVPVPTVALVGYTNAGKSTLFNLLSGATVLASSRMFATLDPKLRAVELPSRRSILLSDTVGFIRNLPHTLVTSFRATLEEVVQAEVLIHVRDAASAYGEEQKTQVEKVLGELDALSKPRIEVLNKIDLLLPDERNQLQNRARSRDEIPVSALTGEGSDALLQAIDNALSSDPLIEAEFVVPQSEGDVLAAIEAGMTIRRRDYEGNLVHLSVTGPASLVGRLRRFRRRS